MSFQWCPLELHTNYKRSLDDSLSGEVYVGLYDGRVLDADQDCGGFGVVLRRGLAGENTLHNLF